MLPRRSQRLVAHRAQSTALIAALGTTGGDHFVFTLQCRYAGHAGAQATRA